MARARMWSLTIATAFVVGTFGGALPQSSSPGPLTNCSIGGLLCGLSWMPPESTQCGPNERCVTKGHGCKFIPLFTFEPVPGFARCEPILVPQPIPQEPR